MIKNIVFDIGNVLVRFQPDEAMREIGIEENKIAALAHATYENPVWVELARGVIPAVNVWTAKLEGVFHTKATDDTSKVNSGLYDAKNIYVCKKNLREMHIYIMEPP